MLTTQTSIRPGHLDDDDALVMEVTGQTRAIGAGSLHADPVDRAMAAEPGEQFAIAGGGRRELLAALQCAPKIEGDCVVGGGVSIDAADDAPCDTCREGSG